MTMRQAQEAVGNLLHINILTHNSSYNKLCAYLSQIFNLPCRWGKTTRHGTHTSFSIGPTQLVVSRPHNCQQPANKHFILSDLYHTNIKHFGEHVLPARYNSVVNLTYQLPNWRANNLPGNWGNCSKFGFSYHDAAPNTSPLGNVLFCGTPIQTLSHVFLGGSLTETSQVRTEPTANQINSNSANQINSNSANRLNSNSANRLQAGNRMFSHVDHVLLAIEPNLMQPMMEFYQEALNFNRVPISENEPEDLGLVVDTGGDDEGESGMRMKALEHWKCDGLSIESRLLKTKFVLADTLNPASKDQITQFIRNHGDTSGVQHIALHTSQPIMLVVRRLLSNGLTLLPVPEEYYADGARRARLAQLGYSPDQLQENRLLVDYDLPSGHLLQTFTAPVFDGENTLFLEVIQRVGLASGFGQGNIRALWRAVRNSTGAGTGQTRREKSLVC